MRFSYCDFANVLEAGEPSPPAVFPWRMFPGGHGRFLALETQVVDRDLVAGTSRVQWTLRLGS